MATINIKGYDYRHFDNMLIVLTEDDKVLYLYCPSECIYDDGRTKYYCYKNNMEEHLHFAIKRVSYKEGRTKLIDCDGIAEFIVYDMSELNNKSALENAADYGFWKHYNNSEAVDKDKNDRAWGGVAQAFSTLYK